MISRFFHVEIYRFYYREKKLSRSCCRRDRGAIKMSPDNTVTVVSLYDFMYFPQMPEIVSKTYPEFFRWRGVGRCIQANSQPIEDLLLLVTISLAPEHTLTSRY